jgi:hypothetical protein
MLASTGEGEASPEEVSALVRATIFVRNLEKAATFYAALGLGESYFDGTLDHPAASGLLGFAEHYPYRVKILKRPGPNFGMVGLFELDARLDAEAVPLAGGPAQETSATQSGPAVPGSALRGRIDYLDRGAQAVGVLRDVSLAFDGKGRPVDGFCRVTVRCAAAVVS